MALNLDIRLARWVIEDGEPEMHVGDVFQWFVEFHCKAPLSLSENNEKVAISVGNNHYRIEAEVIYISKDPRYNCCVLDFGITAIGPLFAMPLPSNCKEGNHVTGEVRLEFPLCTDIQPYDVSHTWQLNSITAELPSSDLNDASGPEILNTGSLKADSYILHCSHVSSPAPASGRPPIKEEALQYLEPPWTPPLR